MVWCFKQYTLFCQGSLQDLPICARQHLPHRQRLSFDAGSALRGDGGLASHEAVDVADLFRGRFSLVEVDTEVSKVMRVRQIHNSFDLCSIETQLGVPPCLETPISIDSDHGPWKTWKGFKRAVLFITKGCMVKTSWTKSILCVCGLMILCSADALTTTVKSRLCPSPCNWLFWRCALRVSVASGGTSLLFDN